MCVFLCECMLECNVGSGYSLCVLFMCMYVCLSLCVCC